MIQALNHDRNDHSRPTITPPPPVPFRCEAAAAPRRVVLAVTGELDIATAPRLANELRANLVRPIDDLAVDLEHLTFIDSSGIAALSAARRDAEDRGVELTLVSVPPNARRVLEVAGMVELFGLDAPRAPR